MFVSRFIFGVFCYAVCDFIFFAIFSQLFGVILNSIGFCSAWFHFDGNRSECFESSVEYVVSVGITP